MRDIFVSTSKDDKNISKKLVSKLESEGYSCYVLPRNDSSGKPEKLISESKIFLLILSSGAEKSEQVAKQLKIAVENNLNIIPFRAGKTENNLGMQYMLDELEWVDAYEDGFNEAYDILLEIIEEITQDKKTKPVKKTNSDNGNFEITKTHLYTVIGILFLGIIWFAFFNKPETNNNSSLSQNNQTIIKTNNSETPDIINKNLKPEEQKIVGSWKMTDYEDSRNMNEEERRQTEQNIEQMKTRVLLTFSTDRSFERAGFTPQVQKGYWEYDATKNKIYLIPENTNQKEEINIINLTDNAMTFVVTESVETSPGKQEIVTTKLTFQKQ